MKNLLILFILIGAISLKIDAQNSNYVFVKANNSTEANDSITTPLSSRARFPGGDAALANYMKNNLKYDIAEESPYVGGTIEVYFTITIEGEIIGIKLLNNLGYDYDKEAIRIVKSMPRWIPAIENGQFVKSSHTLPVVFDKELQPHYKFTPAAGPSIVVTITK